MDQGKRITKNTKLMGIEDILNRVYDNNILDTLSLEEKSVICILEEMKAHILKTIEEGQRLKSKAIWITEGETNTKFFQHFANGRRLVNVICDLQVSLGKWVTLQVELELLAVNHFPPLLKDLGHSNILNQLEPVKQLC